MMPNRTGSDQSAHDDDIGVLHPFQHYLNHIERVER